MNNRISSNTVPNFKLLINDTPSLVDPQGKERGFESTTVPAMDHGSQKNRYLKEFRISGLKIFKFKKLEKLKA